MKNFRMAGMMLAILAVSIAGCIGGAARRIPFPGTGGGSGNGSPPAPAITMDDITAFNWHGANAMKTERELSLNPESYPDVDSTSVVLVGLAALKSVNCSWIGVPHSSGGAFAPGRGGRHWDAEIHERYPGSKVIRTFPHLLTLSRVYMPAATGRDGNMGVNLAWAINQWQSPAEPGAFIRAIVDATRPPIDGIGLELEDAPWKNEYAPTDEDRAQALSGIFGRAYDISDLDDYAEFRAKQITLVYRMLVTALQARYPQAAIVVGYSGFQPEATTTSEDGHMLAAGSRLSLLEYHGVDWNALLGPLNWQGARLSPVTHPMLTSANRVEAPQEFNRWVQSIRQQFGVTFVFNDQLNGMTPDLHLRKAKGIIGMMAPGDLWGLVDQNDPPRADGGPVPHSWNERDNGYIAQLRTVLERIFAGSA